MLAIQRRGHRRIAEHRAGGCRPIRLADGIRVFGRRGSFAQEQEETRLFEAIHRLPIEYRQVITLTLEDMSYSEIAEVLGIGESNVGVRLNRARQMLRQLMETQK